MKHARIFLGLITVAVATRTATLWAQPSSEDEARSKPGLSLDLVRERYDQAFKREAEFFENAVPHLGDGGVREWSNDQRKKLRDLIDQTFQARQELQRAELRELQRRLEAIGRAMHDREQHKDVIIDTRLNDLIRNDAASDGYAEVVEQRVANGEVVTVRRRVPVKGIQSPAPPAPAYVEEQVVKDGQIVRIMKPVVQKPEARNPVLPQPGQQKADWDPYGDPNEPSTKAPVAPPRAGSDPTSSPLGDFFDIETRERLAELDVQAEEENYAAAEKKVEYARRLSEQKAISESEFWLYENGRRRAAIELKRAKAKLEGVERQRAELEAAADAAVKQAESERELAAAKVQTAMAARDAARGEIEKAQAEVESAQAKVDYEQKQYARFNALTEAKAVDENLLIERKSALDAAKSAVFASKTSVSTAKANFNEFASAIDEAQAGLKIADAHLRAAQAQRDRLVHRDTADIKAPAEPAPATKTEEQSK